MANTPEMFRKIVRYILLCIAATILLAAGLLLGLYWSANLKEPEFDLDTDSYRVTKLGNTNRCGNSALSVNRTGIWELTTGGDPITRGAESGALLQELMYYQEKVFVDQIHRLVPSKNYLGFLKALVVIFNRNIGSFIPKEYQLEIAAQSRFCTHEFDDIGTPYFRQINYHAAHDIGHAMQEYMLVGCSSFAAWDSKTSDSSLLVGRNFDFWVGDDFAKNKLVTFCSPDKGHSFASVGWPGMCGVLSGMNTEGLTVTLNAAKGSIPTRAATPISLLARSILQYASTIEEALTIADTTRTFVSESLLIASAKEHRAAIIEKTPSRTILYVPDTDHLRCTNHYQSEAFANDSKNQENIATTDSPYRFERLGELMDSLKPLNPERCAAILRNRMGLGGVDIGLTNPKSLNQAISHHAVIFQPEKLRMWVSSDPWQAGAMVYYDLRRIFTDLRTVTQRDGQTDLEYAELTIPADERFLQEYYPRIVRYRKNVLNLNEAIDANIDAEQTVQELLQDNPRYFKTHELCGDYFFMQGDTDKARLHWEKALRLEIPYAWDKEEIERKLRKL